VWRVTISKFIWQRVPDCWADRLLTLALTGMWHWYLVFQLSNKIHKKYRGSCGSGGGGSCGDGAGWRLTSVSVKFALMSTCGPWVNGLAINRLLFTFNRAFFLARFLYTPLQNNRNVISANYLTVMLNLFVQITHLIICTRIRHIMHNAYKQCKIKCGKQEFIKKTKQHTWIYYYY